MSPDKGSTAGHSSQDREVTEEEIMLYLMEEINARAGRSSAGSAVKMRLLSDRIFDTIAAMTPDAIRRMNGKDIVAGAGVIDDISPGRPIEKEEVDFSAGAAIAILTGAEIAHRWKDIPAKQRGTFGAQLLEKRAKQLEEAGMDPVQLLHDPPWRTLCVEIIQNYRNGFDAASIIEHGLPVSILKSEGSFSAEMFDDPDLCIAEIVYATLRQLEKLCHDLERAKPTKLDVRVPADIDIDRLNECVRDILGNQSFDILYPAGNPTCLIEIDPQQLRAEYPSLVQKAKKLVDEGWVDQVGFFSEHGGHGDGSDALLEMSGGEFCLNATISLAALLYGRTTPVPTHPIKVQCSGGKEPVNCQCSFNHDNTIVVRAVFPVDPVIQDMPGGQIVHLPGITHFVVETSEDVSGDEQKAELDRLMTVHADAIRDVPAVGLIQFEVDSSGVVIRPTVYVRSTHTCVNETACGSGTAALTFVMVNRARQSGDQRANQWEALQPSGSWLTAIHKDKDEARGFKKPAIITSTVVTKLCGSHGTGRSIDPKSPVQQEARLEAGNT